jgi:oligoribonuclease
VTDKLLWVDLETTGLGKDSHVLEVGAVVTDRHRNLTVRGAFLGIISPTGLAKWDLEAVNMHERSGLLADIEIVGESLGRVDNRLQNFISEHFDVGERIQLAGAGVHFDKPFIERDFPWLGARLGYTLHDASVLRRWMKLVDIDTTSTKDDVPHRALDDLFLAIRDARILLGKARP